jgi:hypothetical protein
VRAIVHKRTNPAEVGVNIPVDVELLVSSVVVSPLAPWWFREVVLEVVQRFGYEFDLPDSQLLDEPFFWGSVCYLASNGSQVTIGHQVRGPRGH